MRRSAALSARAELDRCAVQLATEVRHYLDDPRPGAAGRRDLAEVLDAYEAARARYLEVVR